jgi:cation transport ATPase
MHSVQNESLCMYIVILLCIVYKILTTFFFNIYLIKKQLATWNIDTWPHMAMCPYSTRLFGRKFMHVATWPRVKNTRIHMDTCINIRVYMAAWIYYTRPLIFHIQPATLLSRHMATVTVTVDTLL